MLVRPLMTSLNMTVRDDCAVSASNAVLLTLSIKALTLLLVGGGGWRGVGLWTPPSPPPTPDPQLLASEMRQTFLSTNLAFLLAFEWQAAAPLRPTLLVTKPGLKYGLKW